MALADIRRGGGQTSMWPSSRRPHSPTSASTTLLCRRRYLLRPTSRIVFSGGYSAAYYSYIWSEVLDADTVQWFHENGGPRAAVGMT